jgi:hypothetical protein
MRYFLITFVRKVTGQIEEQVQLVEDLVESEISIANIILDFKEKKVIRSDFDGRPVPTNYDVIVDHYRDIYPQYIEQLEQDQGS